MRHPRAATPSDLEDRVASAPVHRFHPQRQLSLFKLYLFLSTVSLFVQVHYEMGFMRGQHHQSAHKILFVGAASLFFMARCACFFDWIVQEWVQGVEPFALHFFAFMGAALYEAVFWGLSSFGAFFRPGQSVLWSMHAGSMLVTLCTMPILSAVESARVRNITCAMAIIARSIITVFYFL